MVPNPSSCIFAIIIVIISIHLDLISGYSEIEFAPTEWSSSNSTIIYDSIRCGLSMSPITSQNQQQKRNNANDSDNNQQKMHQSQEDGPNPANPLWKVMGGSDVHEGDFPWAAALFRIDERKFFKCSGTLISKRHVITAAHCFDDDREEECKHVECCRYFFEEQVKEHYRISLGSTCLRRNKEKLCETESKQKLFSIKRAYYLHYYRYSKCNGNDIAILELAEEVPANLANHICLPHMHYPLGEQIWMNLDKLAPTSFGWGRDPMKHRSFGIMPVLQRLEMPNIWEPWICRLKVQRFFQGEFHEDMLCTEEKFNANVCAGDSGGGLIVPFDDGSGKKRWFLLGAVSFGTNCTKLVDRINKPVAQVYTNVSYHWEAIVSFTGIEVPKQKKQSDVEGSDKKDKISNEADYFYPLCD